MFCEKFCIYAHTHICRLYAHTDTHTQMEHTCARIFMYTSIYIYIYISHTEYSHKQLHTKDKDTPCASLLDPKPKP